MRPDSYQTVHLRDYAPTPYAIDRVDLDVQLNFGSAKVVSTLEISRRANVKAGTPLLLDGDELVLKAISVNGVPLSADDYEVSADRLLLKNPPDQPFSLRVETRLEPENNTRLMGLYRSSGTWCTQCEAEGFRRITYFLDRPDVLSVYRLRIEADKEAAPVLLGNGNRVESGPVGDQRHYAIWDDPWPKPAYLFALVAGDLGVVTDSFVTMSGRKVELGVYVEHGNESRATYAMDALKRSMRWDEDVFGREYDLDIFNVVAVSDFNMGAMENKGLNIFNDKYVLADPEVATDSDYAGIEAVIAHEYFHNWTGNRITCRDWFQLCLKEGLTVFRDQEFSSDMRSRPVKRIGDVRTLRSHQFPEDGGPLAHPVRPEHYKEINNFYTATVYEKGAEVIRMLKTIIGDRAFRDGMDLYFRRHDGDASTIEEFIACFAEVSGRDLGHFMLWYSQAGTPVVDVIESFDQAKGVYRLTFTQDVPPTPGQPRKAPHVIPVRFGLVGADGRDQTATTIAGADVVGDVILLDQVRQEVTFTGLAEKPVPSLFREFSAPVKPRLSLPLSDLTFLMRHDSDPFNRWQSSATLAMTMLVNGTDQVRRGEHPSIDTAYLDALGDIVADPSLDAAFRGLILAFPGENDIAREIGKDIDPDAIHAAYSDMRAAAGRHLKPLLLDLVLNMPVEAIYQPNSVQSGQRALANAALDLLSYTGDSSIFDLVANRFAQATNMTDRLAALSILVHRAAPQGCSALDGFYDRFANVPLVVDKWLSVQATIPSPLALEKIDALTNHAAFSFRNPNRTRALIGAFAQLNPTQFGRKDGKGFDYVASIVMAIDASNPQLASRLLVSFRSWKSFEPVRQAKAEAALRRIAATSGLSRDSADIVERMMA